ncbi:MAG: DNA methylase [Candidatus Competibacteraceae bacterium]|nr:DNA methylase [Candidatus Competibacteraceae bacterium]
MELRWHQYKYYPYELDLAVREVQAILSPRSFTETKHGIKLEGPFNEDAAERLVYFASLCGEDRVVPTMQAELERVNGNGQNRQSTRYSAHGIHEYKGKFNPQIARAILNILNIPVGGRVLDPFCGSGTSLLECAHLGMKAVGADINPLAVFIANAKLSALTMPAAQLQKALATALKKQKNGSLLRYGISDARYKYLSCWFDQDILMEIDRLRLALSKTEPVASRPLLVIASNLLRDYSLQDPHDLRIRRRKTPLPAQPFIAAFEEAVFQFIARVGDAQDVIKTRSPELAGKALLLDSCTMRLGHDGLGKSKFDCAITSPPYATALPYIDTQRLSLVWLGLLQPSEILTLEARLVGSREVRGESKKVLLTALMENRAGLPKNQSDYCRTLQAALSEKDGFRRQAVPLLLYRYFAGMAEAFRSIRRCVKDNAPFALIVGYNHTILGGKRFDIETPQHLAELAEQNGWIHDETITLQTYQRYGYHMNNAVNAEALVIVKAA